MCGAQLPPRYRPLPLPLPWPAVKREPLRYYRPEAPPPMPMPPAPAVKRDPADYHYPDFDLGQQLSMYATGLAVVAGVMVVLYLVAAALTPDPRLFVRLVKAEGLLDVCEAERDQQQSPLFELAVDVDMIQEEGLLLPEPVIHVGGGDHMLRVSYRGVVLAWGAVPRFTISHRLLGRRAAGVVTVVATAQGSVLREDMRNLIRAERRALGKVEFEANGNIPGLGGHLHCKFYLDDEDAQPVEEGLRLPCLVQKKTN